MNYHIQFVYNEYSDGSGKPSERASAASIKELPEAYIHFAHHDFDVAWNEATKRQEIVRSVDKFFGGMGEGSPFDSWQRALLSSLYDLYQVEEGLREGDTFEATYRGETQLFRCVSCHVVMEGGSDKPQSAKEFYSHGWTPNPKKTMAAKQSTGGTSPKRMRHRSSSKNDDVCVAFSHHPRRDVARTKPPTTRSTALLIGTN